MLRLDPGNGRVATTRSFSVSEGGGEYKRRARPEAASVNDWSGVCRTRSSFHEGPRMAGLEIFDRIGGGDSFVSGFTYGLLEGFGPDAALAFGVAHGALAMTTPGDT